MRKILLTMAAVCLCMASAFPQGKPKVPQQTQKKTETTKQTKNTNTTKSNTTKKNPPKQGTQREPEYTPPPRPTKNFSMYENINGFDVYWAEEVTQQQHDVLAQLIRNMVYVPGGTFNMGSQEYLNTTPVHTKSVSPFHIGKYEVTQKEWETVVGRKKHYSNNQQGGNYPVETVSYNDCLNFISKLNRLTGLNFRVPTEAEWEFAAKGGTKSQGYRFSGSNTATNVGWTNSNSGMNTHPVGQLQPNELGLYDMTGNVNEWVCERNSANYSAERVSQQYVVRGGNYYWGDSKCTNCFRYASYPEDAWADTGLRLAITR